MTAMNVDMHVEVVEMVGLILSIYKAAYSRIDYV